MSDLVARLYDHGEFDTNYSIDERTPIVSKYQKIYVKSFGSWSQGTGGIWIDDVLIRGAGRGWYFVDLDEYGNVFDGGSYDTYGSPTNAQSFSKDLQARQNGHTIILGTHDEPTTNAGYFINDILNLGFTKTIVEGHGTFIGIVRKGGKVVYEQIGAANSIIEKTVYEPKGVVSFPFDGTLISHNGVGGQLPVAYRKYIDYRTDPGVLDATYVYYTANMPFLFECEFKMGWDGNVDKYLFALGPVGAGRAFDYGVYTNKIMSIGATGYSRAFDSNAVILQDKKYHVRLIYDGSILNAYLDGVLVNSRAVSIGAANYIRVAQVFESHNNATCWMGEIWNWKFVTNPIISSNIVLNNDHGVAIEEAAENILPPPDGDTEILYDYEGWEVVHKVDASVNGGFEDWMTARFFCYANEMNVVYVLSFWAKWTNVIQWQTDLWGFSVTVNWIQCPAADPTKYQRYVAQVWSNQNTAVEMIRTYYANYSNDIAYIANPMLQKRHLPTEYMPPNYIAHKNVITKSVEDYSSWNTNSWWLHGAASGAKESTVLPNGNTGYAFKGYTGAGGLYCYPPYSRESYEMGKYYVAKFWIKRIDSAQSASVYLRNSDPGNSLNATWTPPDYWQQITTRWLPQSPSEMFTFSIANSWLWGVEVYTEAKQNGYLRIPFKMPTGDFTIAGRKYSNLFDGNSEVHHALVRSGSTFKYYVDGAETNGYQNKYRRYDSKGVAETYGWSRDIDLYIDPSAASYISDSISDFMNLSVDHLGRYYRAWVYCSADVTTIHRYSADNVGHVRINNGTQINLGDWNPASNPDVTIAFKQGWNLIEYNWMDMDSGGGFNLSSGAQISGLPQVLYMTAEMPFEILEANIFGYNNKSNTRVKNVAVYNYALATSEIKELSSGAGLKVTHHNFIKSVNVKEQRAFPFSGAYYFPLASLEDSKLIATNMQNCVFERGCVWAGSAVTNLFTNPKMDNASGWSSSNDGTIATDGMLYEGLPFENSGSVKVVAPTWYANVLQYPSLADNKVYTLSSWIYAPTGTNALIYVWYNNPWQGIGGVAFDPRDKWGRQTYTFTSVTGATGYQVSAGFIGGGGGNMWVCRAQIEQRAFATHWANGSRGDSKIQFNLNQSIGLDWSADWSLVYWMKPVGTDANDLSGFNISSIGCYNNSVGGMYRWWGKNQLENKLLVWGSTFDNDSFNPSNYFNKWIMISAVKSGSTLTVSEWGIDGIKKRTATQTISVATANAFVTQYGYDFSLSGYGNGAADNSYFKDLLVYKYALTNAQLDALYSTKMRVGKNSLIVPTIREYL